MQDTTKEQIEQLCGRIIEAARYCYDLSAEDKALTRAVAQVSPRIMKLSYGELLHDCQDVSPPSDRSIVFESVQGQWITLVRQAAPRKFIVWLFNVFTGRLVADGLEHPTRPRAIMAVTRLATEHNTPE